MNKTASRPPILIPLLIALAATVLIVLTGLDHITMDPFFNQETGRFEFSKSFWEVLIYNASPVPAFVMFSGGVLIALVSIWRKSWRRWTRSAIYWALVMALGPGLVVNGVFKDWYGRPRPKQTIEYGGSMEFRQPWVVGIPKKAKSFPCGHASIGFYFMAGYFAWWRSNRKRAIRWLIGGLLAGTVVGIARMAAGAHWLSDVVWAAVFIYFTSYLTATACGLLKQTGELHE